MESMRMVNIAELKKHLSRYLKIVRSGEEIIICNRNRPIARMVAIVAGNPSEMSLSKPSRASG
jgi:prevent-host-death family protein